MAHPGIANSGVDAGWLAQNLSGSSSRMIEDSVLELVNTGQLPSGSRMPTVRDLARQLGVSPASVADAWKRLRAAGLIETRRRGGTIVKGFSSPAGSRPPHGWMSVDLTHGTADPALLPSLQEAMIAGLRTPNLHEPHKQYITESLLDAARKTWPFPAQAWTTGGGGTEAALLAFQAAAPSGSIVAVEEPTSPRILHALEEINVRVVPVTCDAQGPEPESLAKALRESPTAFIYQPRAQFPLGHAVSSQRLIELADVLVRLGPNVWIVEDDNTGPISMARAVSIGTILPDRVLHIRSYCKTYGVDLRTSVVAGAPELVSRLERCRSFGAAMTSRILQDAVAHLITSAETERTVAAARQRYALRRNTLATALRTHGLSSCNEDGIGLWIPVTNENAALVNLASYGVTVGAGSRCFSSPPRRGYLRIATSRLPDNDARISQLANIIATAVEGVAREILD